MKGIIAAKLMYGSANNAFRILHKDLGGVSLKITNIIQFAFNNMTQ